MNPDALQASAQVQAAGAGSLARAAPTVASVEQPAPTGVGFGEIVGRGLAEVNQQLLTSQVDLQKLATGSVQNLHQIMIRLEESRLSFQLFLQVRNRLLEAYQDLMKMQV